ncbi:hypothetical protein [Streptomyces sp. NPDC006610]
MAAPSIWAVTRRVEGTETNAGGWTEATNTRAVAVGEAHAPN